MGCSQGKPSAPTAAPRADQVGQAPQTLLSAPKEPIKGIEQGQGLVTTVLKKNGEVVPLNTFLDKPTSPTPDKSAGDEPATREVSSPRELKKVLEEQKLRQQAAEAEEASSPSNLLQVLEEQRQRREESQTQDVEARVEAERVEAEVTPLGQTGAVDNVEVPNAIGDTATDMSVPGPPVQTSALSTATFGSPEAHAVDTPNHGDEAHHALVEATLFDTPLPDQSAKVPKIREDSAESSRSSAARRQHGSCCC